MHRLINYPSLARHSQQPTLARFSLKFIPLNHQEAIPLMFSYTHVQLLLCSLALKAAECGHDVKD